MDEGLSYRRRRGGPEDLESFVVNPMAGDLPDRNNDALSQPAFDRDEIAAGADRDLSVALEPAYQMGLRGLSEDGDAAMATNESGQGATSAHAAGQTEEELIPHRDE